MSFKESLIAYILDKSFNTFKYDKIDRLQIEKITYLVQALLEKYKITEGFDFVKLTYGPYSEEVISILEELIRKLVLTHGEHNYEYKLVSNIRKCLDITFFEKWEAKLNNENIKILNRIFNEGKDSWQITEVTHQLAVFENTEFGDRLECSVPEGWGL